MDMTRGYRSTYPSLFLRAPDNGLPGRGRDRLEALLYSASFGGCSGLGASEVAAVDLFGAFVDTTCSFPNIGSSGSAWRKVTTARGFRVAGSGSVVAIEPESTARDQAPYPSRSRGGRVDGLSVPQ